MKNNKPCQICGKLFPQYNSLNRCCSYACQKIKNTDKKVKSKKNYPRKEYKGKNDLEVQGEAALFDIIWEQNEGKSFLTGKAIGITKGSQFYYNCFPHILAKGLAKYPKFRLYSKNIILLTPKEHFLLDHSSEDKRLEYAIANRCSWNKVYKLRDELKEEYKELYG